MHLGVGGAEFQGHLGGETIERFGLLLGGMLTEWVSWRWVMYVNVAFAAPALIGPRTMRWALQNNARLRELAVAPSH